MTTIDHRILIPVPQHVVWDYIGNLTNNARWQVDCNNLSFLTSRHEGVGTRWRASSEKGKEYVVEIRAWYEGLGYEYAFIDRPPFRAATGRIRLQEIPEGTVVQWTIEYELGGMLGGVRNTLRTGRQLDNDIAQSLKKLYLTLKTDRARIVDPNPVTKSLMRDAPDAEARAQYKARHPSQLEAREDEAEEQEAPETTPAIERVELTVIEEPPVADDDTRPTRAVTAISEEVAATEAESPAAAAEAVDEPSFLSDLPAEVVDKRDTQEHKAIREPSPEPAPAEGEPLSHAQMIDVGAIERELDEGTVPAEEASATESITTSGPVIPEPPLGGTDSERLMDTSKISIWEIFGVPRPSEADSAEPAPPEAKPESPRSPEVETVTSLPPVAPEKPRPPKKPAATKTPEPVAEAAAPTPEAVLVHTRIGLRLKLRRKLVHLRRWN